MESYILAERIANAIMMDKSFKGYFLIVEGLKDYKLYSKFIDTNNVHIKQAFGYEKVKLSLEILTDRGYANKFGIIDSDFSKILGIVHDTDILFTTDDHDIEVMIIKTNALECVLRAFCNSSKIETFEKTNKKSVRERLFELGKEIGLLKLANNFYDLGLVFKPKTSDGNQIKYKDFIDDSNLTFKGINSMIDSIINYSRNKSDSIKSKEEILLKLEQASLNKYDLDHLTNGHDLTNILYLLIKKVFSSNSKMLNDFNSIEESLVLAYEYDEFKKTYLYKNIQDLESKFGVKLLR